MSEQKRIGSYAATMSFKILAESAEEAEQLLQDLVLNLGRFDDLSLVKGEME